MMDALLNAPCGMGMWVASLAALLLVALVAWSVHRWVSARRETPPTPIVWAPEPPLRALTRQYLHGELSTQEYAERCRLLGA